MLSLWKPSEARVRQFLAAQAPLDFSYAAVGATAAQPPAGFQVDRSRVKLGDGDGVFQAARSALQCWQQFRLGWVEAWCPESPIRAGTMVAVLARVFGLWMLSACRVVYVIDEDAPVRRFGYAYGTLPGHVESGEELFLVEHDGDGAVWYEILAFSRPRHPLARLGYPLARHLQARFRQDSSAALLRAVAEAT